jgi:pyruvate ferredoxin oxidoreductase alpha subunit
VIGFVIGLGGRDIPVTTVQRIVAKAEDVIRNGIAAESEFVDVNPSHVRV